jgi:cytosine/adenosine deaminase-related metal-dependent hydrolase
MVLAGTVAPMAPGAEDDVFPGRVWLGDDGLIAAVTRDGDPAPPGFESARVVDVGEAVIHPGFIDLHSHVGYNTLPLWVEPTQTTPFLHHDIWPGEPSYRAEVGWPAWTLLDRAPETLLAYIQVRALAGGTTAIQGWPTASRPATNRLVRCIDDDQIGPLADPIRVSALTLDQAALASRATAMRAGRSFIYHCAEGQPRSRVVSEFEDVDRAECLQPGLIAVHGCALDGSHFDRWAQAAGTPAGTIVWSPLSNLWLYGITTDVPAALATGLTVALGTDWGPSGTKNLLGELKVARSWSENSGWGLTDHQLVAMVTSAPGDALARAWQAQVGRLQPGALADVTVLSRRSDDVWTNAVTARERDVQLVVVGGRGRYGTKPLMDRAGERATTPVRIGRYSRRVPTVRPDDPSAVWPWAEILGRLDAVRADAAVRPPSGPAAGRRPPTATAPVSSLAGDPAGTPAMVARLDMPGAPQAAAGPPPKGQTVDIPPIEPVHHDPAWLATIAGRGFHAGALDGLPAAFR